MQMTPYTETDETERADYTGAPATPRTNREAGGLVLYAIIRASSKYVHQGREDGKTVAMRVEWIEEGEYAFHLENGNRYRREDLTFYTRYEGQFIKLR